MRDVLHLDAVEAALELANLVYICPHLRAIVLLHHLVDHQLRVAADHQALDTKARRRPEADEQALILGSVVRGLPIAEVHLYNVLEGFTRRRHDDHASSRTFI
jgi:hypothetical protein